MSKLFKHIAVIFLWLAFLIISAHQIIPHDHHITCSGSETENSCHAGTPEHLPFSHGFPLHCHAFNDLVFEKSSPVLVVAHEIQSFQLYILNNDAPILTEPFLSWLKISDTSPEILNPEFSRNSRFRAPPAQI